MASTRRAPLTTLPNGGNSPFRAASSAQANSLKRTRQFAEADTLAATTTSIQHPPAKKHIIDAAEAAPVTPRKTRGAGTTIGGTTPLQKKHASRVREPTKNNGLGATADGAKLETYDESVEKLRAWQRHNAKVFPTYVFYFDSVMEPFHRLCVKDLKALGSREAQFFSREVTHVITTRGLPADPEPETSEDPLYRREAKTNSSTINPSLLEKSSHGAVNPVRGKFTFEPSAGRRALAPTLDAANRRAQPVDMLQKAKEMGIKIWTVDKFQRILDVMFDDRISAGPAKSRAKPTAALPKAQPVHQDLQTLIRNEEVHGPSEQELKLLNDTVPLKGPYIYIRCVNEKVKPIMVRQWATVDVKEDGEWPQFRSVSPGKCPFVPEDPRSQRYEEETRAILEAKTQRDAKERQLQRKDAGQQLRETMKQARKPSYDGTSTAAAITISKQPGSEPLPQATAVRDKDFKTPFPQRPYQNNSRPAVLGAEPMASGMQASNITSAIRSQMISSTAAAPGVKAGTSREIHGLQRKVLERGGSGSTSSAASHAPPPPPAQVQQQKSALTRSHEMTNLAGDTAAEAQLHGGVRDTKQKAQEKLCNNLACEPVDVEEEVTSRPPSRDARTASVAESQRAAPQKAQRKKEPKPGYCENCREKFEDFDEHTLTKRHRKFAVTRENWKELDGLLAVLGRPLLEELE